MKGAARGAVVAIALVAAACAGPGAGLDPFPEDGVSGFGPAAPVDVCIGSARVAPGGAVSLCLSDGSKRIACVSDAECQAPERCECGQCIVRACGPGSICPSGEACRGGRCTPSCTEDTNCAAGEQCSGGGCTRACAGDADCHRGEVCDFLGVCAASTCGPQIACGAGQTCEALVIDGDAREPAFVQIGDAGVFFFELRSAEGSSIYRATASDPLHFKADPESAVLVAPAGKARVGAPSAVVEGGSVRLFVAVEGGESIGLAGSEDGGRTFTWVTSEALIPEETWEDGVVTSPGAIARGGVTYVFYEGGDHEGIGLAKLDGDVLTRASEAPILRPADLEDATFWRSVKQIGAPFALADGDAIRLYVTANGVETGAAVTAQGQVPTSPNDSIGLFATVDLETFERYPAGPVYRTIAGLFGSLGEREPQVRFTGGGADLYFVSTDASGAKSSGLSRASTAR